MAKKTTPARKTLAQQVSDAHLAAAALPRNSELEALIAEDPDDSERYLVYSDWLQGHDHPRGTLIALQHADKQSDASAFFAQHFISLIGRLADHEKDLDLEWRWGFVRRARYAPYHGQQLDQTLRTLLEQPSCAFVQELEVEVLHPRGVVD